MKEKLIDFGYLTLLFTLLAGLLTIADGFETEFGAFVFLAVSIMLMVSLIVRSEEKEDRQTETGDAQKRQPAGLNRAGRL